MCLINLPKTPFEEMLARINMDQLAEEQDIREPDDIPISSIKSVVVCGCGSENISEQESVALDNNVFKVAAYEVEQEILSGSTVEELIAAELAVLNITMSDSNQSMIFQSPEVNAFAIFLKAANGQSGADIDEVFVNLAKIILHVCVTNYALESGCFPRLWLILYRLDNEDWLYNKWLSLLSIVLERCANGVTPRQAFFQELLSRIESVKVAYGVNSEEVAEMQEAYDSMLKINCFFPLLP